MSDLHITSMSHTQDLLKIQLSDGRTVYTRECYLNKPLQALCPVSSDVADILSLGVRRYLAECKACNLINYSENSRFLLELKLRKKGFSANEYALPLDYLQKKMIIDDFRFAKLWIKSRLKKKHEGKLVLKAKLMEKGICSELAEESIKDAFLDESEITICKKAISKLQEKKLDSQQVMAKLHRLGFSSTVIKNALQ